jgi:arylsulfatase A-like enzyme
MKLTFLITLCGLLMVQTFPPAPSGIERVIVISLDGTRPDAVQIAETPHLQALAARGAVSWNAQTIIPPVTLPSHTSMLTGLPPEEHGVAWNGTNPGCEPISVPTILTLAEQAGYTTAMIVGKEKFCHLRQTDTLEFQFAREGDRSVVDEVLRVLEANSADVLFVHLPNPDYFGHSFGWMSATYIYELRNTDAQVGRILDYLALHDLEDSTLIIISADHGGHGLTHGENIPEDMTIPWIVAGPGIQSGLELTQPVSTMDTAATVLWALGISLPERMVGVPVWEAFGLAEPVQ